MAPVLSAVFALLFGLAAFAVPVGCATAQEPSAAAAPADGGCGGHERSMAQMCVQHCGMLCHAVAPSAASVAPADFGARVSYAPPPAGATSLSPVPDDPPPR